MSKEVETKADPIEKVVREFLRDNPDFLDKNTDILETMVLPHNSGKASFLG